MHYKHLSLNQQSRTRWKWWLSRTSVCNIHIWCIYSVCTFFISNLNNKSQYHLMAAAYFYTHVIWIQSVYYACKEVRFNTNIIILYTENFIKNDTIHSKDFLPFKKKKNVDNTMSRVIVIQRYVRGKRKSSVK